MPRFQPLDLRRHGLAKVNIVGAGQDGDTDHYVRQFAGQSVRSGAGLALALVARLAKDLGLQLADLLGKFGRLREHEGRIAAGDLVQAATKALGLHLGPITQLAHRQVWRHSSVHVEPLFLSI